MIMTGGMIPFYKADVELDPLYRMLHKDFDSFVREVCSLLVGQGFIQSEQLLLLMNVICRCLQKEPMHRPDIFEDFN